MTAFFSFPETTSNATLCLVIKDMEKLKRRESGLQDVEALTMRDCPHLPQAQAGLGRVIR